MNLFIDIIETLYYDLCTMIFDIQRFSTHDGPGIRTIVFLKGCSLRCTWCANTERQSEEPEILFSSKRCIGCRSCLAPQFGGAMQAHVGRVMPNRTKSVPLALVGVCPSLAIRVAGKHIEIDDLMTQLVCDRPYFMKSGGGVTFSGGEPLNQPEFVAECVTRLADLGVGSAIETCLAVERKNVELLLPLPLYWLVDVKHVDEEKFLQETGGHVEDVLSNIALVARSAYHVTFRIPLIPSFNHSDEDRKRIFDFIASLERAEDGPPRVDILPCHDLAAGKYMQLGRPNPFKAIPSPSDHLVNEWKSEAKRYGFTTDIGG